MTSISNESVDVEPIKYIKTSKKCARLRQSNTNLAVPPNVHYDELTNSEHKNSGKQDFRASESEHDIILYQNGYKKIRKICATGQGAMYEAEILTSSNSVCIKRATKFLHNQSEAIQDDDDCDMKVIVDENVVKEAVILKHLTIDNKPKGGYDYIAKYVDI
eukprot:338806_1